MSDQPRAPHQTRADQRPPDAPADRLPKPLRILDSLAAAALHHAEHLANGIRYRHAMQLIPPDELDYHQDEHCLCGPMVEAFPLKINGARWLVRHYPVMDDEDEEAL